MINVCSDIYLFFFFIDKNERLTKMYIYLCSAGAEYGLQCGFSRLVKVDPEIGLHGCGISITDSCYLSGRLVVQFA